jgi:hypothetical protein
MSLVGRVFTDLLDGARITILAEAGERLQIREDRPGCAPRHGAVERRMLEVSLAAGAVIELAQERRDG